MATRAAPQPAHPAPERVRVGLPALWFGLYGGPLAWSVQTLVNLPIAAHGCFPRLEPLSSPATNASRIAVIVVSIAALCVCVAAAVVAYRSWTRTREEQQGGAGSARTRAPANALAETGEGRTRFMALAGLLTSLTFLVVSLVHTASIFLVTPCGIGR
jgi:hypothetical protein